MMTSDAQSEPVSGVPALASPSTSSQPQQASPADRAEPTTSLFSFFSRMALARTTTSGPMQSGDEDGEPFSEQEQMAAAERQLAAETASLGSNDDGDDDDDSDGLSTETSTPTCWDPAHPSPSASLVQDSDAAGDIGKQTWTAQDKVEALQKEFGPAAADSSERWLAESYGGPTTRSGLLIVGSLHVTSHRLLFYGKMPSLNDASDASPSGRPIKTGAAYAQKVYNRFGIESTHRKRIWLELENDMVTSYRDSTARGRTEPLKVVRLSAIKRILDETLPLVIEFESAFSLSIPCDLCPFTDNGLLRQSITLRRARTSSAWNSTLKSRRSPGAKNSRPRSSITTGDVALPRCRRRSNTSWPGATRPSRSTSHSRRSRPCRRSPTRSALPPTSTWRYARESRPPLATDLLG